MRRLVAAARVGRLATINADGSPHLVPFVFALEHDTIYSTVDDKPKRSTRLRRVANIERDPRATVLADHYQDAWEHLWWVRVDGLGRVVSDDAEAARARELLGDKYDQYEDLSDQTVIAIDAQRWTGWSFSPPSDGEPSR